MTYEVELTATAESDIRRLDSAAARRVVAKMHWLAENLDATRLETLTGEWRDVFKLRVGDYRVLYTREVAEQRIIVHFVRHRREIYRMPSG